MENYCHKQGREILRYTIALLSSLGLLLPLAFAKPILSSNNETINLEGKIVRNDAGYEGLNVTTGSPACVVSGNANDTCDFQVRYYSGKTSGTLFFTETFENVEIGQYNGAFNLSLGSGVATSGSYTSLSDMVQKENDIFVEMAFSPAGDATYTEIFSRMPLQSSAYSIRSKYSSGASGAFQFNTSSDASGYTTPSAGMVYYDTTSNTLKIYNGTSWENIASGSSGSNLWSDAGNHTYLTSTTDSFVLGSSTYTAIGGQSYTDYLLGLSGNSPFAFDMGGERLSIAGDKSQSGLTVLSSYSGSNAWPLVTFKSDSANFDSTVLNVVQSGTGKIASFSKGDTEAFSFENDQTFYIAKRTDAPSAVTDRIYNVGGALYWNGSAVCTLASGCGSSSLWTDSGTYTYLTSTTDNVGIGGSTPESSKFFFDTGNGRFGIGTSSPGSKLDIVGDGTAINLQEWRDSSGSVLSSINQYGYATFGRSTGGNAILSLGANTNTVPQMNFASSNGVDLDAPVNGDLWWNGTNLYFFDGNEKIDLLAGGSAGILSNNGLVPDGGYIDVVHGKNTYSVLANGWVCVGGSNDEQCTGGEWVDTGAKVAGIKYVDNPAVWKTNNSIMQYPYISPDGILHSNISDSYNGFHISDFYIGGLAAVDRQTGKLLNAACPKVKGSVSALISDGNGGYYIGGDFTHVGNIPRSNIAHVNADCSLDMNFNPGASGSGYYDVIKTLLLDKNNNKLYVGGSFNSIGGENIQSLARIDISNGLVDSSFNLNLNSGSNIYTFSLDGSNLYVGGIFNSIGGENRKNLAIVDIFSVSAGILNLDVDGSVNSIFIDSDSDTVYIGGSFSTVGGQSRRSIASITRSTGALKSPISLSCDGTCSVYKIIMNGNTLYVGGYLGSRYDPKSFIAIDLPSGTNTVLCRDDSTSDFAIDGNTIYLSNLKAINATTGDLVHSYEFYSSASTVLLEDNNLYFGGRLRFTMKQRDDVGELLHMDAKSGDIVHSNCPVPDNNDAIVRISDGNNGLYIAGSFQKVGETERAYIAHINADCTLDNGFAPTLNSSVNAMWLDSSTSILYLGGSFTSVNGESRNRVASINIVDGSVTSFNPDADNEVLGLLLDGTILYVGGQFTTIGGQNRNHFAAIDTISGNVKPLDLSPDGAVKSFALDNTTLYIGGSFNSIGGESRNNIAAIDTDTGSVVATFNLNFNSGFPEIKDILIKDSVLYMSGSFSSINGIPVDGFASFDIVSSAIKSFDHIDSECGQLRMSLVGEYVYVHGVLASMSGLRRSGIFVIDAKTKDILMRKYPLDSNDTSSKYKITIHDNNNVRLYNNSGSDKYLKLTVSTHGQNLTSGYSNGIFLSDVADGGNAVAFAFDTNNNLNNPMAKLLSVKNHGQEKMYIDANGNLYIAGDIINSSGDSKYLALAPTMPQVDTSSSSSIWINKTGAGGDLVRLQTNGSDVFVVNRTGNVTMSGNASVDGGTLTLGNNGNIRFNNVTNQIEFSKDGGTTWIKMGDAISKIVLSAEYAGAVLAADGSSNTGTMTSDNTFSSFNSMNYYEWNSSELTLNDYDIRVRITLPSNFDTWGSGGITIHYATESTDVSNNKLDASIFEQSQSTVDASSENNVSQTAGVWRTAQISGADLNQCVGANTTCILNLKLSSLGDNYVRVGDIVLDYSRTL